MKQENRILLWLDDYRDPKEDKWLVFSPIPDPYDIVWVKSYNEFVSWINENGLPTGICFDHDLADQHYAPETDNYKYTEKTGMDCAKWLIDHCIDNNKELPKFASQSANPSGRENILALLNNYKKHGNRS